MLSSVMAWKTYRLVWSIWVSPRRPAIFSSCADSLATAVSSSSVGFLPTPRDLRAATSEVMCFCLHLLKSEGERCSLAADMSDTAEDFMPAMISPAMLLQVILVNSVAPRPDINF